MHTDYKGVVQRLRRTYERKVEELQHHEEAEAARLEADTSGPTTSSSGTRTPTLGAPAGNGSDKSDVAWPPEHWTANEPASRIRSNSGASSRVAGGNGSSASDAESPPVNATSPTLSPVFVSGATSSSTAPTSAYRDPPSAKSSVFEALAKRDWSGDKQRVNSIVRAVGSLGKGGEHSSAPRNARSRQYGGRLKREAEQAGTPRDQCCHGQLSSCGGTYADLTLPAQIATTAPASSSSRRSACRNPGFRSRREILCMSSFLSCLQLSNRL